MITISRCTKPRTLQEIKEDENFWKYAKPVEIDGRKAVTIRIKKSVLEYFKQGGSKGYQTRINKCLESYVQAHQK